MMGEHPARERSDNSGDDRDDQSDQEEEDNDNEEEEGNVEEDKPDDLTKSPVALEHLKCLLNFMDADISAKQLYLDDPQCRKVFFSDLWLLYRPGIEVIGSNGKQAYRVIEVTSAKHRVTPAWQRWYNAPSNKRNKKPFSITCVHIDFDGKNLGPVQNVFDFNRFDGERDITSLEVYPLRFHPVRQSDFSDTEWKEFEAVPDIEKYRQKLINRGNKFLEVAAVKHMYYAGPTLEMREEVESQVVIDFETAFSVEDKAQHLWKPDLTMLIGNPSPEGDESDDEDESCKADCCRGEFVHDDSYVDQKQRNEYIESLLPKANAQDEQPSIAIMPRPLKEVLKGPDNDLTVSKDELAIMSYRVFGFVLRSRKWAKLDLAHLSDVHRPNAPAAATKDPNTQESKENNKEREEYTSTFNRLVLEKGHKNMIESLIAQHFRDKKSTSHRTGEFDIVRGKGKGLILLLHGAPGVGKTSTAEGVAEMFKKPLFQITCGDLGTTAPEVEKALETNFALANRWDCILLLDEADVFLAERTKEDFKRNGLVAVFLRVMEYYAGILFLTTNRVGDFDEAFTSRIHISLYYPALDMDKTTEVFKINMEMIEERFSKKERRIDIDKYNIGIFAAQHFSEHQQARWNGRQIRNACQTALALAEFEAQGKDTKDVLLPNAVVELRVRHFEIVRDAYLEFTKYMINLHGTSDTRRAKEAKLRAIWIDENDRLVTTNDIGGAEGSVREQPQQQYYQYQNLSAPQQGYHDASQMQTQPQQFPTSQLWSSPGPYGRPTTFQGPTEGHEQFSVPQQTPPTPTPPQRQQQQQQQQVNPPGFNQDIRDLVGEAVMRRDSLALGSSGQGPRGQASNSWVNVFATYS
ncbi:uncharacterized protein COCSADRAFT_177807 [Neofusicoccum parvum]|nr:uncharacterized protein COCSADRAFT_177807 [Neofusicoccum parvum]